MAHFNEASHGAEQAVKVATISAGVLITGNVECDGVLQVNGRVNGEVRCATVFIDESGIVDGAIEAERLRVSGIASGTITVNDLAIEASGTVSGQTSYERAKVASGGTFEGNFTSRANKRQATDGDAALKLVKPATVDNPRRVYVD